MTDRSFTIAEAAAEIKRSGKSWVTNPDITPNITFAFRATGPNYDTKIHNAKATFTESSAAYIDAAVEALELWSDVADVDLTRVGSGNSGEAAYSDDATILFGSYASGNDGAGAFTGIISPGATGPKNLAGDVWINTLRTAPNPSAGDPAYFTFLHEIGHALGLEHPGNYDAGPGIKLTYEKNAEFYEDTQQYTVMSYFAAGNTGAVHNNNLARTPLVTDIHALQLLYGANTDTRTGNTIYGFNSNADRAAFKIDKASEQVVFAIWDAGGEDTLDVSRYGKDQLIDLRPGKFSSIGALTDNVAMPIAPPDAPDLDYFIENAIGGTGHDKIVGNGRANRLEGGDRNDTIDGGARSDTLLGGDGLDRLDGGDGNDLIEGSTDNDILDGGADSDTAVFSGKALDYDIIHGEGDKITIRHVNGPGGTDRLTGIEFAEFDGDRLALERLNARHGTKDPDTLYGTSSRNDYLSGGGGNDTIGGDVFAPPEGNPEPGNDMLSGGAGDDTLFDHWGADTMLGGAGSDHISGGGSDERADLLDGGEGNDGISVLARHAKIADTVRGGSGDDNIGVHPDSLYGRKLEGEDGDDQLFGGRGNDTLIGGDDDDLIHGGEGDNLYSGGEGNDKLEGADTGGFDTLEGGAGNDSISFVSTADRVRGGNGASDFLDIVRVDSALRFKLDLNRSIEVQVLADGTSIQGIERMNFQGGSGNDVLEGVAASANDKLSDWLIGNAGNDILDGGGGADILEGGLGNDNFYVDRSTDTVLERNGEGTDVVHTSSSFTLTSTEIEVLVVQNQNGTEDFDLTGDDSDNLIVANAGDNTLTGKLGNDTLAGGGGDDLFYVNWNLDVVREAEGRGIDRVIAVDSEIGQSPFKFYALAKGAEIEILEGRTTADMNLTGNELANTIIGNKMKNSIDGGGGDDILHGLDGFDALDGGRGDDELKGGFGNDTLDGGAHKDTLAGGFGDDTYVIHDLTGDVVVEDEHADGIDEVWAFKSHTLAPGVEDLVLKSVSARVGFGNASANSISGNGAGCILDGLGGADTLYGVGGDDNFRFSSKIGSGDIDNIRSYDASEDTILLSASIFTGLTRGKLAAGAFVIGQAAVDPDDRIIYIAGNGGLYFDADGSKTGASAIQFALLDAGLKLTSADFLVV